MTSEQNSDRHTENIRFCPQEIFKFQMPVPLHRQIILSLKNIDTSAGQLRSGGRSPGFFLDLDHHPLKDNPTFAQLQRWLFTCLCKTRNRLPWSPQFFKQLEITQSWINVSEHGNDHAMHTHPLSILSGILSLSGHVETNFYVDSIYSLPTFMCPDAMDSELLIKQTLRLESGVLVIFPSTLKHDVSGYSGSEKRLTLSFNSFFSGMIGDPSMLAMINS